VFAAVFLCSERKGFEILGLFGVIWGLTGVFLLLGNAIVRLAPITIDAFSYQWFWYHWFAFGLITLILAYAKGYKALQKGFSPRVAARAKYLMDHPDLLRVVLAPLFCMGYFGASRKRQLATISVTAGIVILIVLVRVLQQPWRGIIDGGVVIGLVWGLVSLSFFSFQAMVLKQFDYAADVPDKHA
jgi:hypothetical protein